MGKENGKWKGIGETLAEGLILSEPRSLG